MTSIVCTASPTILWPSLQMEKPEVGLSATSLNPIITFWSFQHARHTFLEALHPLASPASPLLFFQLLFCSGTAYNYVIFHSILPCTILYLLSIPFCLPVCPPPRLSSTNYPLLIGTQAWIFFFFFCRNRNLMVPRACYTRFFKIVFDSAEIFDFPRMLSMRWNRFRVCSACACYNFLKWLKNP